MSEADNTASFPGLSRASASTPESPSQFPDLEGYEILETLPRGGQAAVYKAIQLATKAEVAVKVLPPSLCRSQSARHYFEREVELIASLRHPNIVSIRDSGIARGQYFFSMEFIRGSRLDEFLDTGQFSLHDQMRLFRTICDAVAHAHQHGVIHRDLKPSNILVDERGEPHVLDFGLAKSTLIPSETVEASGVPTVTGEIRGTLAYMSPEQAMGQVDRIEVRSDVYALGMILYRVLTKEFPYEVSGSALATLENIKTAIPVRPRKIIGKFDSDVEAIIMKCLAKSPNQRYQSAAELRDEIDRWLEGLPILAKSVSSVYLLRKVIARHRYTSAVAACLLVMLTSFTTVYFQLSLRLQQANDNLQAKVGLLSQREQAYGDLARQMHFCALIDAWRNNRWTDVIRYKAYLTDNTREGIAWRFLTEEGAPAEKEATFRTNIEQQEPFFVAYVIAEAYLQAGDRRAASMAFKECFDRFGGNEKDGYLKMRVKEKLYDLDGGAVSE